MRLSAASEQTPAQAFLYAEGARLPVPVFNLAARADLDPAEWDAWFSGLAIKPAERAYMGAALLAHSRNLKSFLMPLYISLSESKDAAQRDRVLPFVRRELKLK